ncbi:MAG: hypothetical protein ALECFALPRED_005077 [Alectoria fallacina]|uniref:Uncharacterized protein n=1 Tax=Alectoria fallacina TaxID=1903189 RepID=A0A8H3IWW9_9LECA|nr:MAG: hypothetical protein ALECFALPRED_005077 [Alectoria fallacina]
MVPQRPDPRAKPHSANGTENNQIDDIDGSAEESKSLQEPKLLKWSTSIALQIRKTLSTDRRINMGKHQETADHTREIASQGQPFLQTHFGKLPREMREEIFINLLETPPPHAGREVSVPYHLKATHLDILHTCRQVYLEAFAVFYNRNSYYAANAQELIYFLKFGHPNLPGPKSFRGDKITTLCVKNLIIHKHIYTPEQLDLIFLGVKQVHMLRHRAHMEASTDLHLDRQVRSVMHNLKSWTSLKKICLCMRVGEELEYIRFLFQIPGSKRGMLDFLDDQRWALHPQPQDPRDRTNQFACFQMPSRYIDRRGNNLNVYTDWIWKREMLDKESRASGLKEGDERYVEVEIVRDVHLLQRTGHARNQPC